MHFRVVGVAPKKGAIFGQSQDEFAVMPLDALSADLRVAPVAATHGASRRDPSLVHAAMDDATLAMRIQRRLRPKEPDNFGVLSSETFLNLYNQATSGHLRRADRRRQPVARRRRHRHHEHHADGR